MPLRIPVEDTQGDLIILRVTFGHVSTIFAYTTMAAYTFLMVKRWCMHPWSTWVDPRGALDLGNFDPICEIWGF